MGESQFEVGIMGEVTLSDSNKDPPAPSFRDKYTTDSLILKDSKSEEGKIVLSNDAYALGLLFECFLNKTR